MSADPLLSQVGFGHELDYTENDVKDIEQEGKKGGYKPFGNGRANVLKETCRKLVELSSVITFHGRYCWESMSPPESVQFYTSVHRWGSAKN